VARYLLRRLGFLFLTLLLTSVVIFVLTQFLPGDVARIVLGREAVRRRWSGSEPNWASIDRCRCST
jgi:ABC-type dipeptide/oligopeptide/nickel transport system permease component